MQWNQLSPGLLLFLLFITWLVLVLAQDDVIIYDGCSIEEYYNSLLSNNDFNNNSITLREDVTRTILEELLTSTHRNVLPYTSSSEDVWDALIDLDPGQSLSASGDGTVRLIYRQDDIPARPHGTSETWNREHLWPQSRGVEEIDAFTDIHHLRPADWNVNSARNDEYFGICGLAKGTSTTCVSPAHSEATIDTESDATSFLPPAIVRGDIARALLYLDIRYGDDLVLTDCPSDEEDSATTNNEMAYLSQLLLWHVDDPVTDEERRRNQRACDRWQGNRNPFVDFPDAVDFFFGQPKLPLGDGLGYDCSIASNDTEDVPIPTIGTEPAPVPSNNSNTNNNVSNNTNSDNFKQPEAGDVMVIAVNSVNPDMVAIVALRDLPGNSILSMTDNSWTGSEFLTNEGTRMLKLPSSGISAGTIFGYGTTDLQFGNEWQSISGTFALAETGDTVILYTMTYDGQIQHLSAYANTGGEWTNPGSTSDQYDTKHSVLPESLRAAGVVSVPHYEKNYIYVGPVTGTKDYLQNAIQKQWNWEGSETSRVQAPTTDFQIEEPSFGTLSTVPMSKWIVRGMGVLSVLTCV